MDWLTTFVDLFNGLGISGAVTLALSTLPLLGMAYEGEDEPPATEDPAASEGDLGDLDTDPDPQTTEEPFLRVNENTVYKTSEAASAGFNEKDRVISSYKQFGSPEEIAAKFASADRFDQLERSMKGGDKPKPGHFDKLEPQLKEQYTNFDGVYSDRLRAEFIDRESFDKAGYIRSEDLPGHVDLELRLREAKAHTAENLKARGLEGNQRQVDAIYGAIDGLKASDPDLYQKIGGMFSSGDTKGAADAGVELIFGVGKVQDAAKNGATNNGRGRDQQGRFTPAELDARKRRTENLPKAPPQSGSRTSQTEERPALLDEKGRKAHANEVIERLAQGG